MIQLHSAFRNPLSAFLICHLSFVICHALRPTTESGNWNKEEPDTQVLAYVTTAYVAPRRAKIA
jgi:hypothetical protein